MDYGHTSQHSGEKGSAIVISLFILALLSVFVALALSKSSAEAAATGNETAESRTFYAAQGSLETMTRNFTKIYDVKLNPVPADITSVQSSAVPGMTNFTFSQSVGKTSSSVPVVLNGGPFGGLYALRDTWQLGTTATDANGVQVQLTRNILNNLVPIFQFGIFYDDNLEFHPGPRFDFGGRVHSNGSLFLMADTGLYFSSKVTAANYIFTDTGKNGTYNWGENVFVKNASGTYVQLHKNMGSVLTTPVNGAPVQQNPPSSVPLPTAYRNSSWSTNAALFDGNLLSEVPALELPLKLNSDHTNQNLDLVEVIKRGKEVGDLYDDGAGTVTSPHITPVTASTADDDITAAERYYNKTGIRVSIADSKAKLPGCATTTGAAVTTVCGIQLDGRKALASGPANPADGAEGDGSRGYAPLAMTDGYQASRVNGNRFYLGISNRNFWVKIETVQYNSTTGNYDTADITEDMLSLGVTESEPNDAALNISDSGYGACTGAVPGADCRSVFKIQHFDMDGPTIPSSGNYISNVTSGTISHNYVMPGTVATGKTCSNTGHTLTTTSGDKGTLSSGTSYFPAGFSGDSRALMHNAAISGISGKIPCVVPYPINMFDTREGLYNDSTSVFDPLSTTSPGYGSNVPWAGVMSMFDIDVANLKKFLDGSYDTKMPTTTKFATAAGHGLKSTDIPSNNGWVLYVSDRRGDFDFDGEYDMEDIYGNNNGVLETGEDINKDGRLEADYTNEAVKYTGSGSNVTPDVAAVFEHKYYRRGVRLINGSTVPGSYDTTTPANTKGFTVATENGVYVFGNYNATGIANVGTPTASTDYLPASTTSSDIPASIASDAVTMLSNSWTDSNSFVNPFDYTQRDASETTARFAMLSGDTITSLAATPNQGGNDVNMNGGVHNFKRFLEDWGGTRMNYCGSLINLFNSHNNNGTYKNGGTHVYNPPDRNWIFDASFLDPNRLPPGTPYFEYVQTTGFDRTNN